jgi:hypothetical protein
MFPWKLDYVKWKLFWNSDILLLVWFLLSMVGFRCVDYVKDFWRRAPIRHPTFVQSICSCIRARCPYRLRCATWCVSVQNIRWVKKRKQTSQIQSAIVFVYRKTIKLISLLTIWQNYINQDVRIFVYIMTVHTIQFKWNVIFRWKTSK